MEKSLKAKAVKIQGKDYVMVSDRVLFFNEEYKKGSIQTELVRYENKQIIIKAKVTPDTEKPERYFTGYAQEIEGSGFINKTSALENAETSAIGRALAMMGIGVIESIASADEINKAKNRVNVIDKTVNDNDFVPEGEPPYPTDDNPLGTCAKCGAPNKKSQAGKIYCSALCWRS